MSGLRDPRTQKALAGGQAEYDFPMVGTCQQLTDQFGSERWVLLGSKSVHLMHILEEGNLRSMSYKHLLSCLCYESPFRGVVLFTGVAGRNLMSHQN